MTVPGNRPIVAGCLSLNFLVGHRSSSPNRTVPIEVTVACAFNHAYAYAAKPCRAISDAIKFYLCNSELGSDTVGDFDRCVDYYDMMACSACMRTYVVGTDPYD